MPAEDLDSFNAALVGKIEVTAEFRWRSERFSIQPVAIPTIAWCGSAP